MTPAMAIPIGVIAFFGLLLVLEERGRTGSDPLPSSRRLLTNWGLGAINWALFAVLPFGATLASLAGPASGPLHEQTAPLTFAVLLLSRSFAAYWLHRLFHVVPLLWRIHRVHHSDDAIDTSTGLRNHPFEMLAAAALGAGLTLLLGAPVMVVAAVDAVLFAAALWQHAAIRMSPERANRLGLLLITPPVHCLHHSLDPADHDRNFGDFLSLWDRLFGTWRPARSEAPAVGLENTPGAPQSLPDQLASPFRR